jgi:hypothetical protein
MITLQQAQNLKVGDPVILAMTMFGTKNTTVSYVDRDRLHVDNDSTQFILPNCPNGITELSLP